MTTMTKTFLVVVGNDDEITAEDVRNNLLDGMGFPLRMDPLANDEHLTVVEAGLPWRPIEELNGPNGKYDHKHDSEAGLLLLAPELVDLDCNVHGVGMGFFQDDGLAWTDYKFASAEEIHDRAGEDMGCWLACKWDMSNDEWQTVKCKPTHYIRLSGV